MMILVRKGDEKVVLGMVSTYILVGRREDLRCGGGVKSKYV